MKVLKLIFKAAFEINDAIGCYIEAIRVIKQITRPSPLLKVLYLETPTLSLTDLDKSTTSPRLL